MQVKRQRSALVVLAVALSALVGCTPSPQETPGATTEASPPSSAGTSAVPTTATPPDPADPATWIISATGVGPVEIGGDFDATLAALGEAWTHDTESCAWTAWWSAPGSDLGMFFVRGTETETAPIVEISVYSAAESPVDDGGPMTTEGLGVGASREEIMDAYPEAQAGAAEIGGGDWLMLPGDSSAHVFFEFREGASAASDIVVTTGSEPSYEVCG